MATASRIGRIEELIVELNGGSTPAPNVVAYDVPGGPVVGTGLYHDPDLAIMLCYCPAGMSFPDHPHEGHETLIVSKGAMSITVGNKTNTIGPGESFTIKAGEVHSATADVETYVVAVTIPGDEGYPDAA